MLLLASALCLSVSAASPPPADACSLTGTCNADEADEAALLQSRKDQAGEPLSASGGQHSERWFGRRRTPAPPPPEHARIWAATQGDVTAYPWPEQAEAVGLVARTKSVGISISGGGARSYAAGFGQLRALYEMGLLSQARYLAGTSGGGWVAGVYTYHQLGVGDDVLLGSTPAPSELSLQSLADLPHTSLGWGATGDMLFHLGAELAAYVARGRTRAGEIWPEAAGDAFLSNYGLGNDKYFTLNSATLNDILSRNPHLQQKDFVLPAQPDRPYLLLDVASVGPLPEPCLHLPYREAQPQKCASYLEKLFRPLAASPIYTGFAADRGESLFVSLGDGSEEQVHEGGLVESWAFGGPAPRDGKGPATVGRKGQVREVDSPARSWSLKAVLGATSTYGTYDINWYENGTRTGPQNSVATGNSAIDTLTQPIEAFFGYNLYEGAQLLGQEYEVWDTSDAKPETESVYLSDGDTSGDFAAIQDSIARATEHVISFYNTKTPLCGEDAWDPAANSSAARVLECCSTHLGALFGVGQPPRYGYSDRSAARNQIFPTASFAPFVKALQASMRANKTAFARMRLTTVANAWRRIPAGRGVDLALFYLSPSAEFEAGLPQETREALEAGSLFANFPLYETLGNNDLVSFDWQRLLRIPPGNPVQAGLTSITPQQTNLLAALTGWAVLQHEAEIRDMFS